MTVTQIDATNLLHGQGRTHPAIVKWRGEHWMAYRLEPKPWNHFTKVMLTKCDSGWKPLPGANWPLDIAPGMNSHGDFVLEDLRFFFCKGRLCFHVSDRDKIGLGEMLQDGTVRGFDWLHVKDQGKIEKNWQFFEIEEKLYGIRWVNPHQVYEITSENLNRRWVATGPVAIDSDWTRGTDWKWCFGAPHGGTTPVRYGNIFVSLFNSFTTGFTVGERGGDPPHRHYSISAYAFEARHPFRTIFIPKRPLIWATPRAQEDREPNGNETVFAVGLLREGDNWTCGYGDDINCFLAQFTTEELFQHLIPR